MSSINRVRKLQVLYFSKKIKILKSLMRMRGKKCAGPTIYAYYWLHCFSSETVNIKREY